jgi:hypothetical protein
MRDKYSSGGALRWALDAVFCEQQTVDAYRPSTDVLHCHVNVNSIKILLTSLMRGL